MLRLHIIPLVSNKSKLNSIEITIWCDGNINPPATEEEIEALEVWVWCGDNSASRIQKTGCIPVSAKNKEVVLSIYGSGYEIRRTLGHELDSYK